MRLIDADALERWMELGYANANPLDYITKATFAECIAKVKASHTIDAELVRHGRWMFEFALDDSNFYRCSECNRQEVLLAKESTCKHSANCKIGGFDCYHCNDKICPCLTCQYEWRGVKEE